MTTDVSGKPEQTATANAAGELEADEGSSALSQESVNERLLKESKEHKQKYLQAKRELEQLKAQEAAEKGRFKELYEAEKKRNDDLMRGLMKRDVKSAVERQASKAGCVDVEALLKLGKGDLIQYDAETGEVVGVETFVDQAKQTYPYLFNAARPATINPATPGGVTKEKTISAKDIAKMKPNDAMAYWVEAMKQSK